MSLVKSRISIAAAALAILALAISALSQSSPAPPPESDVVFVGPGGLGPGGAIGFLGFQEELDHKVVTGAPFSAQTVTEITEVLADGNRIDRTMTGMMYRDTAGQTRRELALPAIGPWAAAGRTPHAIFINDPVAGVHYILEPDKKIARKMTFPAPSIEANPDHKARREERAAWFKAHTTTESLGSQTMDGVAVEGTRYTTTIPAGQIGNEKPIVITTERWYSPALQVVVMSKRTDPSFGTTTYELKNISPQEPDASLFQVPPDYTVKEGPSFIRRFVLRSDKPN